MKPNKDKEIRELERELDNEQSKIGRGLTFLYGVLLGVLILQIVFILTGITGGKIYDLEQDLELCQDKIPVWTFEFECEQQLFKTGTGFERGNVSFPNYEDYKFSLDWFEDKENCGVIE